MDNYYGVIDEKTDDRDWLGADFELQRAPKGTSSFLLNGATQYNQKDAGRNSCTIHGAMGAYSDLTGYKFSVEERNEIYQEAVRRGLDPNVGWYILDAVKLIRDWVNKNCKDKVNFLRYNVGSADFEKAMSFGYSPILGYRGNALYNKDRDDNGVLDGTEFINTIYGHCLRGSYFKGHLPTYATRVTQITDNYPYRNTNLYYVPVVNWNKLVINRIFFGTSYILVLQ
jgi:hypothetical protein